MISYFDKTIHPSALHKEKLDPFNADNPTPLAQEACKLLQKTLVTIDHNFGVDITKVDRPIGKMIGVLVIKDQKEQLGYISAFSGKLNKGNHYPGFVPPIYDSLSETGFLNKGMKEVSVIVRKIRTLKSQNDPTLDSQIRQLIKLRNQKSKFLQEKLYDSYSFINKYKESKTLVEIFNTKQPRSGSGECTAPKLLQYAFINDLTPISIAEFWWGISPNSQQRIHKQFYPACEEKCRPILDWMLSTK